MLKPVLGLAATGIVALILFKVMALLLLPLIGITIGIVLIAIKVAFWIGVAWFALWLLRRLTRDPATA